MATTLPRQGYYGNGNGNGNECSQYSFGQVNCNTSAWSRWARWLFLGLIILAGIVLFFLFSCITARRRRRLGHQPFRGTGWSLGRAPPGHGQATYNGQPQYNNSNNPPPAYATPQNENLNGNYNNRDVELQQPNATYQGYNSGASAFEPPKEPPPGLNGHGIIR